MCISQATALPSAMVVIWFVLEATLLKGYRSRPNQGKADRETSSASDDLQKEFFRGLFTQYYHQDHHSWSHTNTLAVIQGAILAGSYNLFKNNQSLSLSLVIAGFILTLVLYCLIERIKYVRDYNESILQYMGRLVHPGWVIRPPGNPFTGDQLQRFAIWLLLVIDVSMAHHYLSA